MSASLTFRALSSCYIALESYKSGLLLLSLVVSYGYSSWFWGLDGLQLLCTWQPAQIAVALLGLALFPSARARLSLGQSTSGCSSACGAKHETIQDGSSTARAGDGTSAAANCRAGHVHMSGGQSIRLAGPPFVADLSYGISSSYTCSSSTSSSKIRRRRFPRVSLELTPLPRLSLEFQHRAGSRRLSSDDFSLCSPGSSSNGFVNSSSTSHISRWQPSMTRISSGQDLHALQATASELQHQSAPWAGGSGSQSVETVGEATESLGLSPLAHGIEQVGEVINDTHLLQVGAMLGESSSRAALVTREAGGPVGHPASFYGSADTDDYLQPWDLLVSESNSSVLYWAWRRPLRKGLYMYMTRSVFLDASPAELRAFMNDDAYRVVWDSSMTALRPMLTASIPGASSSAIQESSSSSNASVEAMAAAVAARRTPRHSISASAAHVAIPATAEQGTSSSSSFETLPSSPFAALSDTLTEPQSSSGSVLPHETTIMQALVQFPKPMASRSYVYARRVWDRPSDGGCYCLNKSCSFEKPLPLPCKAVAVEDYVSGSVIRTPAQQLLPAGYQGTAAEVLLVYYEDSHVRPGLANLGIKKGLWPLVQKTEKALRVYQAGAAANVHLQTPQPPATPCRLQSSKSMPSTGLSRAASLQRQGSLGAYAAADGCAAVPVCSPVGEEGCTDGGCMTAQEGVAADELNASAVHGAPTVDGGALQESSDKAGDGCCTATCAADCVPDHLTSCSSSCKDASSSSNNSSKGSKGLSWWDSVATAVGEAIKGSGQLLAAASVALWRSHAKLALLVPTLEWKLLHWMVQRLSAPTQLLLGAPAVASSSGGDSSSAGCRKLSAALNSHPIGDCLHPGLLRRLKNSCGPSLLRVSSHPLKVEDLVAAAVEAESPPSVDKEAACSITSSSSSRCSSLAGVGCKHLCSQSGATCVGNCSCCCAAAGTGGSSLVHHQQQQQQSSEIEPFAGCNWPSAADVHNAACCFAAHRAHACHCGQQCHRSRLAPAAVAALQDDSWSRCTSSMNETGNSCCGCSCCCNSDAVSSDSRCGSSCCSSQRSGVRSSSRCGSSSRVSGGGRRQRRVLVRLMQAASVRLAHKLLTALDNNIVKQ